MATAAKELEESRAAHAAVTKELETKLASQTSTAKELEELRVRLSDSETVRNQLLTKLENLDMQLAQTKSSPSASPSKLDGVDSPTEVTHLRKELEARTDELEGMNLVSPPSVVD